MGLLDRINRLEARLATQAKKSLTARQMLTLSVALDVMGSADLDAGYEVEHDGQTWVQQDGETVRQLLDRAALGCPPKLKPLDGHGVPRLLVATRKEPLRDCATA